MCTFNFILNNKIIKKIAVNYLSLHIINKNEYFE